MRTLGPTACAPVALLVALAAPAAAWAGNGLHPRTEVEWADDTPCMIVLDKAVSTAWHLEYGIPYEDTEVTVDEVADSRTHQFIGFCRDLNPQDFLPGWITQADIDAAVMMNLFEDLPIPEDDDLESSAEWASCFERITADDERRAITFANAEEGVDWDLTTVPEGTYIIYGFTHEPIFNLWKRRPGVVKVIDGGQSTDIGPGGAIMSPELIIYQGDTGQIEGCIDTAAGSTLTASYASTEGAAEIGWTPTWVPFAENEPVDGDQFSVTLDAPEDEAGNSLMIRVDFVDPAGDEYTAFMRDLVIILAGNNPGCDETGGNFIGMPCGSDDGDGPTGTAGDAADTIGSTTTATGSTTANMNEDDGGDGGKCNCRTDSRDPPTWLLTLFVLAVARRRRE